MSNALFLLTIAGLDKTGENICTTGPAAPERVLEPLIGLFAVGTCVLVIWVIRRIFYRGKILLRQTPGRPNALSPGHLLLLVALYWGLPFGLQLFLPKDNRLAFLIMNVCVQVLWLVACLVVAGLTFRNGLSRGLGLSLRHWIFDTGRGVIAYLAVLPMCLTLYWLVGYFYPRTPQDAHVLLRYFQEVSLAGKVLIVFSAVVLAPLAEEVFFRGLMQSMFRRVLRQPWVAILVTAAFFTLFHNLDQWKDMPALFALAVALGYNYERCGRLGPSILIHALFNAVNLWLSCQQ